jgi:hypothetical protein
MSKELIEQLAKEHGKQKACVMRPNGMGQQMLLDGYDFTSWELEAFAKAYQAAAPIYNVAVKKVLDLCEPLETVEYWAREHAREPYKTGGGMTVQLILEYMELRRSLIPTQANRTEG